MLTVEVHGFGIEDAAEVRGKILKIIFDFSWTNKDLDAVEVCCNNIIGFNSQRRPRLHLLTSYSEMANNLIIDKLSVLKLPIHIVSTKVYEGR